MSLNVTPVAEKVFTDEMLAKNFIALAENSKAVEEWFYSIDGQIAALARQQFLMTKKLSGRKVRFAFGVVVGVAVSPIIFRESAKALRRVEAKLKDLQQEVNEQKAGEKYADVVLGEQHDRPQTDE